MNPLYKGFVPAIMDVLYVIQLALLAGIVWEMDSQYASTLSSRMNLMTLGIVAVVSLPYLLAGKRKLFVGGITVFALGMVVLSRMDQSAEKAMNRLAEHIQPGMTRAQIENLTAHHFPAGGRFGIPVWKEVSITAVGSTWALTTPAVVMIVRFSPDGGVQSAEVGD